MACVWTECVKCKLIFKNKLVLICPHCKNKTNLEKDSDL